MSHGHNYFFSETDRVLTYATHEFDISYIGKRILTIDAPETAAALGAESWIKFDRLAPDHNNYDLILINAGTHKIETQFIFATCVRLLSEIGQIIIAGANDGGGKSLAKMLVDFGLSCEETAKQKHRLLWVKSWDGVKADKIDSTIKMGDLHMRDDGFYTRAGIFSWDRIDAGTALLLGHLTTETLTGFGADFGAGIGVIGHHILSHHNNVTRLDSLELDARAIDCATKNLAPFVQRSHIIYGNATTYKPEKPYDFVVTNPPFHMGKNVAVSLGQKFIANAARALKKGGVFYCVANNTLPYETILDTHFEHTARVATGNGFKILKASRVKT